MSDYISKQEAIQKVTEVELQDGTFADAKIKIGAIKTLNEKEIIRKAFERVLQRLERELESANNELKRTIERNPMQTDFALGYKMAIKNAIEIVKEECGISE